MKKVILFFMILSFFSCEKKTIFHITNLSNSNKSLTVFNSIDNNIRYIAEGKLNSIPKDSYIKIDLKDVDQGVGDYIAGCFQSNITEILLPNHSIIIENKLNKEKYKVLIESHQNKSICTDDNYFGLEFHYENLERTKGNIIVN